MTDEPRRRRRYDNSGRRRQAAETRARIVESGAELLQDTPIRDWQELTVRAVADRADVHERTVYRHFGTEQGLRDAVMARLERDAGVDLDHIAIDELASVTARVLRYASAFPAGPEPDLDPTLDAADARRRAALSRVIGETAPDWSDRERLRPAAIVDLLWSLRRTSACFGAGNSTAKTRSAPSAGPSD